jgi:hypothetical protein
MNCIEKRVILMDRCADERYSVMSSVRLLGIIICPNSIGIAKKVGIKKANLMIWVFNV